MKIGIGIDTGGTYTDAVVYDLENKTILGRSKALTTKENLSVGILEAVDALPEGLAKKAELVSLSTTLATNACVEDKGGNAKLIFFGGDRKVIDELGGKYGLPSADKIYIQESYTTFYGEIEREPDWELFSRSIDRGNGLGFEDLDGAGIIEINAMKNGAVVEKKAKSIFKEKYDIPVVCSNELFSELNCLQRGSSTLLNAGLFPIIKEFLNAIKTAMSERGIKAAVVIVRSDGSLMSENFASLRPVETLLCGPAASVIGGAKLAEVSNGVIIDMGGTTTDIAVIKDNMPVKALDGVSIGKWKTFVDGLYVKTFGLGGDSAIHYGEKGLVLEEYRVIPLCVIADKYPHIIANLRELVNMQSKHSKYLHEYYALIKDISGESRYTEEEQRLCAALKAKPLSFKETAEAIGKDVYTMNISRLLKESVVQICGLTPTDIMHIRKDYTRYSADAAMLGADYVAFNLDISVDELCCRVYDEIKRKIYLNVVKVLFENNDMQYMKNGLGKELERFINMSYETAKLNKSGENQGFISASFNTDFSLVGIGAPIHIFLNDVAEMLGTRAVIHEYSEVANALGAIVGNISASCTIEIKPNYSAAGITGYTVFGIDSAKTFKEREEAEAFALSEAENGARIRAVELGARGDISVTSNLDTNEARSKNFIVHLNSSATAQAVGAVGF